MNDSGSGGPYRHSNPKALRDDIDFVRQRQRRDAVALKAMEDELEYRRTHGLPLA